MALQTLRTERNATSSFGEQATSSKHSRRLGRLAVKLTAIVGGAAALFGIGSTAEAVSGHEAAAAASGGYHITGAEQSWCRWPSRWNICNVAKGLGDKAAADAAKVAAEKGWSLADGGADAVRHCDWNALMAKEFGKATAEGLATRHEQDDTQSAQQQEMDLHNNAVGRSLAGARDPVKACVDAVVNGKLMTLTT